MAKTVDCLIKDDWLHAALEDNAEPVADVIAKENLPDWTKPWRKQSPDGTRPVAVPLDGAASSFDVVLWVDSHGVRALWKTGTVVATKRPW
jgi:hypothetical protein